MFSQECNERVSEVIRNAQNSQQLTYCAGRCFSEKETSKRSSLYWQLAVFDFCVSHESACTNLYICAAIDGFLFFFKGSKDLAQDTCSLHVVCTDRQVQTRTNVHLPKRSEIPCRVIEMCWLRHSSPCSIDVHCLHTSSLRNQYKCIIALKLCALCAEGPRCLLKPIWQYLIRVFHTQESAG